MTTQIRDLGELDGEPHATPFSNVEPRTVRLVLGEGESVPEHSHPGRDIVFYLIEGELELTLGDDTRRLSAGEIARFDGEQEIAPNALADSTALIVLAAGEDA